MFVRERVGHFTANKLGKFPNKNSKWNAQQQQQRKNKEKNFWSSTMCDGLQLVFVAFLWSPFVVFVLETSAVSIITSNFRDFGAFLRWVAPLRTKVVVVVVVGGGGDNPPFFFLQTFGAKKCLQQNGGHESVIVWFRFSFFNVWPRYKNREIVIEKPCDSWSVFHLEVPKMKCNTGTSWNYEGMCCTRNPGSSLLWKTHFPFVSPPPKIEECVE